MSSLAQDGNFPVKGEFCGKIKIYIFELFCLLFYFFMFLVMVFRAALQYALTTAVWQVLYLLYQNVKTNVNLADLFVLVLAFS